MNKWQQKMWYEQMIIWHKQMIVHHKQMISYCESAVKVNQHLIAPRKQVFAGHEISIQTEDPERISNREERIQIFDLMKKTQESMIKQHEKMIAMHTNNMNTY